ncbi:cell division and transport-associated protein TolR [Dongia mobilis]|uniref:Cell division and transport-associated protein TolR n=1 Tax=Dongia mobilis TaxID=578943 RepID=A0A4V3DDQ8_9PROT|nr:biopolymer transporter ExbD [Dongia mobilis]TDQ77632.1 cell division and transport-associated protein TolR [Dongia mobilis]
MAIKLGGGGSPSRGHSARRKFTPMSEINVTPMVDVMLVLLIIFMVTAPLLTVGVEVELPKTSAEAMPNPEEPLVVTVRSDNVVFLQETQINIEELGPRLVAITSNKPDTTIYVRGDAQANWDGIAQVLAELQANGFTKVGIVTDTKDGAATGEPAQDAN